MKPQARGDERRRQLVMADEVADWGSGSAAAGPTLRAEVSRAVYDAWGGGGPG